MKTEEQVWTVLVDSNPVPDVDVFGRKHAGDDAHLTAFSTRSSEVTQLDTKPNETLHRTPRTSSWLVAAVLVLVVGAVVILATRTRDEIQPVSPDTTQGDVTETTIAEAAPTTVVDAVDSWEAIPTWRGGTQPNTYRSNVFFESFSFEVPGGWWPKGSEHPHFIDMSPEIGNMFEPSTLGLTLIDWDAGDVESTVASIRDDPSVSFSDTAPVQIGGAAGLTFTAHRPGSSGDGVYLFYDDPEPNCSRRDCGEGVLLLAGETAMVFYVVDVGGATVTIVITDRPGGAFADQAQTVVDSITWKDLS